MNIKHDGKTVPDYKKIYTDLVNEKYPEKKEEYKAILSKENFSILDVIECNKILFTKEDKNTFNFNQKHRTYDRDTILEILDYQKKYRCNNSQLARHFKLSRNTVAKWKRNFQV
ncbi:helix-turn-helix domain-containing protein [Chryseobacterium sp. SIMBA_029]|uniref:helix-turn-helix domain-containing protein n=1 Tax=Chryseobacterium sp. SIMBA_029 TaxID=3085772 RepID=UPI00397E3397